MYEKDTYEQGSNRTLHRLSGKQSRSDQRRHPQGHVLQHGGALPKCWAKFALFCSRYDMSTLTESQSRRKIQPTTHTGLRAAACTYNVSGCPLWLNRKHRSYLDQDLAFTELGRHSYVFLQHYCLAGIPASYNKPGILSLWNIVICRHDGSGQASSNNCVCILK
jgi:hypothetical protein